MKRILYVLEAILGIALFLLAAYIFTSEQTKTLSGLCIGFGGVLTALGIGNLIYSFAVSKEKAAALLKQKKIEVEDERNVMIKERAASMVSHIMSYLFSVYVIGLSFLGADRVIIICASSLLLVKGVVFVIFVNHYAKAL
jgi:hypothetical protein